MDGTGFLRVMEQRDLLGGADLVSFGGRGRRPRRVRVDGRWKVGFAAALALIVARAKDPLSARQAPERSRCPRCGAEGETEALFGTRVLGGERRAQSWCRSCRSAARKGRGRPVQEVLSLT
jgi:hypothetical protein